VASEIFISFASKDVKVAMTLCSALETRGFSCWISARDIEPGANFQVAIVQALRRARVMLLVFTANSNTSEEMTKELALASQQKIMVIPLRVEDVTPNDAFAYEFATRQWIDAFADWESSIDQLARRITHAKQGGGEAPAPVVAEVPAPEPVAAAAVLDEEDAPSAPAPVIDPPPAANQNHHRLRLPVAIAAASLIVALSVALFMKSSEQAPPATAAAPPPRIAAAVVTPAPEAEPAPVEEAPKLVKTSRSKRSEAPTAAETDIPF